MQVEDEGSANEPVARCRACGGSWLAAVAYGLMAWLAAALLMAAGEAGAADSLCARVKIEIRQELTLERQGFDARMRINNGLEGLALRNVGIDVNFSDEDGKPIRATSNPNDTEAAFFIRVDSMQGIDDVSGAGTVQPASSAEIHWLIVPAPGSGGALPSGKLYYVGATLGYTLNGEQELTEVAPDYIYVRPMPLLSLDYFLTRQVYADDPFTAPIEAPEPFTLGVRVKNNGNGTARRVRIDSAQPRIVENEQGLLINFRVTGSSVNDQASIPSLLINLGDIEPEAATVARWRMVTTLSGEFTEFAAEFSHSDAYGGELTSLLEATDTHLLVHDVLVDLTGRDPVRDFLAKDGDVLRVYESNGVDTQVTDQSAAAGLQALSGNGVLSEYRLEAPATDGFFYVRVADPMAGRMAAQDALRSDGKVLIPPNVWLSKSRREDNGWDHYINLFDANTTGHYTIALRAPVSEPKPPVLQFIPGRTTYEGHRVSFLVEASDPNGTIPALSAAPLPPGAGFVDQGNGTGVFDWTPGIGQAGNYDVVYRATDGVLEATRSARIIVCALTDTDCDGMDDDWEREHFGNLDRDGSGDYDGDGASDLDEFRDGTDPLTPDVKLVLRAGLNLISFPIGFDPPRSLTDLMAELGDKALSVRYLTEDLTMATLSRAGDELLGPTHPIAPGEGYLLRMAEDHEQIWTGVVADPDTRLGVGMNLRGFNGMPSAYSAHELLEAVGGADAVTSIVRFDRDSGRFEAVGYRGSAPAGRGFVVRRGEAYLISVRREVTEVKVE